MKVDSAPTAGSCPRFEPNRPAGPGYAARHFAAERSILRNIGISVMGVAVPLVTLLAIPRLMHGFGVERFGLLTLVWALVAFLSESNLGSTRAVTKLVAERVGLGRDADLPSIIGSGLAVTVGFGLAGGATIWALSPWLLEHALRVPPDLRREAQHSAYLLACTLPFFTTSTAMRGILEAHQRFGLVYAIRTPMMVGTYIGPLLVLPFSGNLFYAVAAVVAARLLEWLAHTVACLAVMPVVRRHGLRVRSDAASSVINLSSWMAISSLMPLLSYLDRFVIGALVSTAAVAYYAGPFELVTKMLSLPGAVVRVLFPVFSATSLHDRRRSEMLFVRAVKYLFLTMLPLTVVLVAFAKEGITLWLGAQFAVPCAPVLRLLAIGVLINTVAFVPYNLIQGIGRPDLTAKLHMIELIIYLAVLPMLIKAFGIRGAAIAYVGVRTIDAVGLLALAAALSIKLPLSIYATFLAGAALIMEAALSMWLGIEARTVLLAGSFAVFGLFVWLAVFDEAERTFFGSGFISIRTRIAKPAAEPAS